MKARVQHAERKNHERAGQHEQHAGDDTTPCPVQQPADVYRELLRLRTGQQHAIVERVKESRLADPATLFDELSMHQCDLPGWTAEAHQSDSRPHPRRLAEAHRSIGPFGRKGHCLELPQILADDDLP